jgi:hypothetical protein
VPQHTAQIFSLFAGQNRSAFRRLQIGQSIYFVAPNENGPGCSRGRLQNLNQKVKVTSAC